MHKSLKDILKMQKDFYSGFGSGHQRKTPPWLSWLSPAIRLHLIFKK